MKKIILFSMFIAVTSMFLTGCTENERAKSYGGTASITLPAN